MALISWIASTRSTYECGPPAQKYLHVHRFWRCTCSLAHVKYLWKKAAIFLDRSDGGAKISDILRNYLATEADDAIPRQVMRFMRFRRTDQSIDEYIVEFDPLRRQTESKMDMVDGIPEHFV